MTDRIGVCGGCSSKFKIPPTFQGTSAKCKKCGGTVTIGPAEAPPAAAVQPPRPASSANAASAARPAKSATAPKPIAPASRTAAPSRSAAPAVPAAPKPGAKIASKAGRGSGERSSSGGRSGRAAAPAKKDNSKLIFGGIAAVVVIAAAAYFATRGGDGDADDAAKAAAGTNTASNPTPPSAEPPPVVDAEPPPIAVPETAAIETPPAPPPEPVVVELPSKIEFTAFDKPSNVSDEDWQVAQDAVRVAYLESNRPTQRREALSQLKDRRLPAIAAMINAMNGLDLSQDKSFYTVGQLVKGIQEVSLDVVRIGFRLDQFDMANNVQWNAKCAKSLIDYWTKQMAKPEEFQKKLDAAVAEGQKAAEDFGDGN